MTTTLTRPETTDSASVEPARTFLPLTWLRGLAALVVVLFHAYQFNRTGPESAWPWSGLAHRLMLGSDLFVDMFFVLSGLVLWLPIARAAADGDTGRPGRVLLYRRMARLLPLYYTVVLLVWTLTNPTFPGQHWADLVEHLTFTNVYSDTYIFWTDGPAWSLAVEFHFYVLMALAVPLVHAGVRRSVTRRGRLAVATVLPVLALVVGIGYLLWATVLTHQSPTNWSVWFSPLSRGADFGIGMGLAVVSVAGLRLGARTRGTLAVLGTAALVALVVARPATVAGQWWHPLYALAIAVALASIVLHDGPWPAALEWRPLVWIGGLGYGIYLVHEPVMRLLGAWGLLPTPHAGPLFLLTAVLVAVPATAVAWLSAHTVERVGLKLLASMDRSGRPRDYYAHLASDSTSDATRSRTSTDPA